MAGEPKISAHCATGRIWPSPMPHGPVESVGDPRCRRARVRMSCSTSLALTRVLPSSILTAVSPSPRTTRVSVRVGDSRSHRDAVRIVMGRFR